MQKTFTFKVGGAVAKLEQVDSAKFIHRLEPDSVDMLVTSPPYFIGKEYDKSTQVADFNEIILKLVPNLEKVIKPGGSVCWQVGNHVCEDGIVPLDYLTAIAMKESSQFQLRNRIIWTFSHGNHARRRFSGRHETILWYTKGDNYFFDLDAVRVPQKYPGKRHYRGPNKGKFSGNPLGKNPGDYWEFGAVWDIPNVKANHVEKTDHPCQYPIALVRRLILALCPKGGVVLDPFLGSGTTAVAALIDSRNFIGCDISKTYLAIAISRLNALANGTLKFRKDTPIYIPSENEQVAVAPNHFKVHTGDQK